MLLRRPWRYLSRPFASSLHLMLVSSILLAICLLLLPLAQRRSRTDASQYSLRQKCSGPRRRIHHPADYDISYSDPHLVTGENNNFSPLQKPPPLVDLKALSDFEEYSHIGSIVLSEYRSQLFQFIKNAFPVSKPNVGPPEVADIPQTAKDMASFLLPHSMSESFISPAFPNNIFQTGRQSRLIVAERAYNESLTLLPVTSSKPLDSFPPTSEMEIWMAMAPSASECKSTRGPGWNYIYLDDTDALKLVADQFGPAGPNSSSPPNILEIYQAFARYQPVMAADLFRYIVLAVYGGIYADVDTVCYLPPSMWWDERRQRDQRPSLVIGLEDDAISWKWGEWKHRLARPVQIAQWIMAAAPGHPVVVDSIRRISEKAELLQREKGSLESVKDVQMEELLNFTGPGVWTDSVLRYLKSRYGLTLDDIRQVTRKGPFRVGDVLILPRKGFHASWRDFVIPSILRYTDRDIYSEHLGAGSWKKEPIIQKVLRSFTLIWDHLWNIRI